MFSRIQKKAENGVVRVRFNLTVILQVRLSNNPAHFDPKGVCKIRKNRRTFKEVLDSVLDYHCLEENRWNLRKNCQKMSSSILAAAANVRDEDGKPHTPWAQQMKVEKGEKPLPSCCPRPSPGCDSEFVNDKRDRRDTAAVLECLAAELLELAGNAAKDNKRSRATPRGKEL